MRAGKFLVLMALVAATAGYIESAAIASPQVAVAAKGSEQVLADAFKNRRSNLQVQGQGTVIRLLSDDLEGSKHQRFIIRLSSGQTLLISHNIDLAPRINSLQAGDAIAFYGEYEWNSQGGIIHWTHRDPAGRHVGGWIKHKGRTYQ